jgi:hypothetical protein
MATKKKQSPRWWIVVTFNDEKNNGFVILGSAGWDTQAEWEQQWQALLLASGGTEEPTLLAADKFGPRGARIDEKRINIASAARLLGCPPSELVLTAPVFMPGAMTDASP